MGEKNELLLRCNDRLHGLNAVAAYTDLCQHLEPFLATLYTGQQVEVEHYSERTSRLTVGIKVAESLDVDTWLRRLDSYDVQPDPGPEWQQQLL